MKDRLSPLQPQDLLIFTEMSGFIADWEEMGLDVDFDLLDLQVRIMVSPKQGPVVPGTGGLRKMDFAPVRGLGGGGTKRGKRHACRVCYVYFEEFGNVLLVCAYAKNQKVDISADEKKTIKQAIVRVHKSLSSRYYR